MHQFKIPACLIAVLMLTACGDGEESSAAGESVAKSEAPAAEQPAERATR